MSVTYSGSYASPRADLGAAFTEYMAEANTFIANQILAVAKTTIMAGSFSKLKRASILRAEDVKRADNGDYNRVRIEATDDTFSCKERGVEIVVDDRKRAFYANDFDLELASASQAAMKILLRQEIDAATAIFNTTTWTGSTLYTDVSSAPWDTASSGVLGHVAAAKEKVRALTGIVPNTLVLSEKQFQNLLVNDDVLLRFPGASMVTEAMLTANLGAIFGLSKVLRGKAVQNTGNLGGTETIADIWSDDYAMVCVTANAGDPVDAPCVGRTFLWTPDSPEELVIEEYVDPSVRGKVLRARHDTDPVVIDASYGHLLKID